MPFPAAGRRRRRRQRRFAQAVENGSRSSCFLIQIFQSWHFYGRTVADVQQNSRDSVTVAGNWCCRRGKQMWGITFQTEQGEKNRNTEAPTSLCNGSGKRYVENFQAFSWQICKRSTPFKKKRKEKEALLNGERLKFGNNRRICCCCVFSPMAPSPLKSSQHKWIDLAL